MALFLFMCNVGCLALVLEFSHLFLCMTETRNSLVLSIQLPFRVISKHKDKSLSYSRVYCGGGGGAHSCMFPEKLRLW